MNLLPLRCTRKTRPCPRVVVGVTDECRKKGEVKNEGKQEVTDDGCAIVRAIPKPRAPEKDRRASPTCSAS